MSGRKNVRKEDEWHLTLKVAFEWNNWLLDLLTLFWTEECSSKWLTIRQLNMVAEWLLRVYFSKRYLPDACLKAIDNFQLIYDSKMSNKTNQTIHHWNTWVLQPRTFCLYRDSIDVLLQLFFYLWATVRNSFRSTFVFQDVSRMYATGINFSEIKYVVDSTVTEVSEVLLPCSSVYSFIY